MNKCLIFIENGNIRNAIDLLEVGRQIFGESFESTGVCLNNDSSDGDNYFDRIINIKNDQITDYDPAVISRILSEIHNKYSFSCILVPATQLGRMLAPRLAMRLRTGLVADITSINSANNRLEMIRPAFSGKIMAGIINVGKGPAMMSVRQNVFTYSCDPIKKTFFTEYIPEKVSKSTLKLIGKVEKIQSYDINDSSVLISGGGGVASNFDKLNILADALGGRISASRKIVDKGITGRSIQVGQSGKTVSPELYIALGISGAIQHIEGLKNVEHLISVNTNRNAPICSLSDIVVEGDASDFIEKLANKINNEKINKGQLRRN